jgi:hypothetical protein
MRFTTIFLIILSFSAQTAMAQVHDPRALAADPSNATPVMSDYDICTFAEISIISHQSPQAARHDLIVKIF